MVKIPIADAEINLALSSIFIMTNLSFSWSHDLNRQLRYVTNRGFMPVYNTVVSLKQKAFRSSYGRDVLADRRKQKSKQRDAQNTFFFGDPKPPTRVSPRCVLLQKMFHPSRWGGSDHSAGRSGFCHTDMDFIEFFIPIDAVTVNTKTAQQRCPSKRLAAAWRRRRIGARRRADECPSSLTMPRSRPDS